MPSFSKSTILTKFPQQATNSNFNSTRLYKNVRTKTPLGMANVQRHTHTVFETKQLKPSLIHECLYRGTRRNMLWKGCLCSTGSGIVSTCSIVGTCSSIVGTCGITSVPDSVGFLFPGRAKVVPFLWKHVMSRASKRTDKYHKPEMSRFASATSSGASANTIAKPLREDVNHQLLNNELLKLTPRGGIQYGWRWTSMSRVVMKPHNASVNSPVENPRTRIISPEADWNVVSLGTTDAHCIPHNGVIEVVLPGISASNDIEVVL